ncbi:MAG: carboxypeptidase regulatory-like domain-containing protein [Planctomycetota bacterium]
MMRRPVLAIAVISLIVVAIAAVVLSRVVLNSHSPEGRDGSSAPVAEIAAAGERDAEQEPAPAQTDPTDAPPPPATAELSREPIPSPSAPAAGNQGLVVDSSGSPLVGVSIHIVPAPDDQREFLLEGNPENWFATGLEVTSDGEGRFPLEMARTDVAHAVVARLPGYGWDLGELDPLADPPSPPKLTLVKSASLRGRVVDHENRPIRDATVSHQPSYVYEARKTWSTARALSTDLTWEVVQSDPDGYFSFREVSPGYHDLRATAEGYAEVESASVMSDSDVTLMMLPAAVVYGRVTDVAGKPIPRAQVRTGTYGAIPPVHTPWITCDDDGSYKIDSGLSGSVGVTCWTETGFAMERMDVWIAAGSHTQVDFTLQREERVRGRIVDSQERPVAGIRVVTLSERHGYLAADSETREDGWFEATGLVSGDTYRLWISPETKYGLRAIPAVPAGVEDLEIRLLEKGTIWGTVSFEGEAASDVSVRVLPRKDLPANSGLMVCADHLQAKSAPVPLSITEDQYSHEYWPAIVDLEFRATGYAPILLKNVTIPPGKAPRPIDLFFALPVSLQGSVLDVTAKSPIGGASLELLDEDRTGQLVRCCKPIETQTDLMGQFSLPIPKTRSVALLVTCAGYAPRTLRDITVHPQGIPLQVELTRGGRVEGRVETTYASPSSTIEIVVREIGRHDGQSTFVDTKGAYAVDNVPPGRVEVVLNDRYYRTAFPEVEPQVRQAEVRDGETVRVDFDAATGVTLRGRVEGWDRPLLIEARQLSARDTGDEESLAGSAYTDRKGCFAIPHLRPGRYRVASTVGQPGYSIAVAAETTIAGKDVEELVLRVPGNTLEGHVRAGTGEGIARAIVTLSVDQDRGSPLSVCLTDLDGAFAVGGIDNGLYELTARAAGFATESVRSVQVPAASLEIALEPEARLRVVVADDLGSPLPGAPVSCQNLSSPALAWKELTGPEGVVRFAGLKPVPHLVSAELDGYVPPDPLIVPVQSGEMRSVSLVLVRAGELEVTVVDPDGRTVESVAVLLMTEEGEQAGRRVTNKKGSAFFRNLAPAWYEIHAGEIQEPLDLIEVEPGAQASVTVTMSESRGPRS